MSNSEVFLNALGSGSSGNSFFIESPKGALLLDQGFSRKELLARMKKAHCDPGKLCGARSAGCGKTCAFAPLGARENKV